MTWMSPICLSSAPHGLGCSPWANYVAKSKLSGDLLWCCTTHKSCCVYETALNKVFRPVVLCGRAFVFFFWPNKSLCGLRCSRLWKYWYILWSEMGQSEILPPWEFQLVRMFSRNSPLLCCCFPPLAVTVSVEKRWLFLWISPGSSLAAGGDLYSGIFVGLHLYLMSQPDKLTVFLVVQKWICLRRRGWFTATDPRVSQFKMLLLRKTFVVGWILYS